MKNTSNQKLEKTLQIECLKCPHLSKINQGEICVRCLLNTLYINKKNNITSVYIQKSKANLNLEKIQLILEYFKRINVIKKSFKKIKGNIEKKCTFSEFKCDIKSYLRSFINLNKTHDFLNPIITYNQINDLIQKDLLTYNKNELCLNCKSQILQNLSELLINLQNLEIIQKFNHRNDLKQVYNTTIESFNSFLFGSPSSYQNYEINEKVNTNRLREEYFVGTAQSFKIEIYDIPNMYEKKYVIDFGIKSDLERDYILKVINSVTSNLKLLELSEVIPLEELISRYEIEALLYLKSKYQIALEDSKKIAFIVALRIVNLDKIFPVLLDDNIEEIFLDSPNDKIYVNHQKYGRCRTDLDFSLDEIERLKTFLRIYSGKRLDFSNPSLKAVLKNKYFNCRFAIDVKPLHAYDFALDIRKLNKNVLNIQNLIKNSTLDSTMAAFVYFLILNRVNITSAGETDSGKTTIINALDLITPQEFRKIYIENVIESLEELGYEKHQLKYQVDSLQDDTSNYPSKHNQIKNLLHRSPDLIYLGEILTKEEAEAMFHCLSAGLKGFQTIHCNNVYSLINRLLFHFKINFSCLNDLGIIIFMKKLGNRRFISLICEITANEKDHTMIVNKIFKYDPHNEKWIKNVNLYDLEVLKKIREYKVLNENQFNQQIDIYTEIFEMFKSVIDIDNSKLIKFFDQL
ncbi:MAG: ATPase, T2SS/T4P/T4SS family, partial [Candidatus Thorarchaeota archaeon]